MKEQTETHIGQVVRILRGKDAGQVAVILSKADNKFVYIADGDKRKFDQAKKKNLLHLDPQPFISSEVVDSLIESGRVTNGKLRHAVMKFNQSTAIHAEEKGD
ncbi:KOW domain-containing RNA-binding protein [Paenibacillus sp. IHBB 10380]|uniref:KOW domain-containing RNA-binding protein n=1 Tax=Paenibacillus sp. IHBB 10380 TaxID=1566358 RepID=UPI0005CFDA48|nr:KOW domain-containing RNA-binding protein [Paenibacillus sp. IHBB 10380]AJS60258.1 KOW domain-containing protein [Paenibacillus sp. IHBB 10380]